MRQKAFKLTRSACTYALVCALWTQSATAQPKDAPLIIPQDKPFVLRAESGELEVVTPDGERLRVVVPEGFWVNDKFAQNTEAQFHKMKLELADAQGQRDSYAKQAEQLASQPGLTWQSVALLVGIGVLVGAGAATGVVLLSK